MLFANVASFVAKLVLARLLLPEHFGLVGMAVVFTGLIQLIESLGINTALIQRKDDDLSTTDLYSAHLGVIGLGFLCFLFIIVPGSPLVAWFYDEPDLFWIVIALGIPVFISPFSAITGVKLTRAMRFDALAKIQMATTLVGAVVAIGLAFAGAGVWAIVSQTLVARLLHVIILRTIYGPVPKGEFSWTALRRLVAYGINVVGYRIAGFAGRNADYLIIGKMVGSASLGAYTLAFLLTDSIRSKLMSILEKVLFPAYSKLQDNRDEINRYYLGAMRFNTLLVAPVICAFLVFGEELLLYGFGSEWEEAVAPLKILSFAALIASIGGTNSSVLKAIGKPNLVFRVRLGVSVGMFIPALLIGIHFFGLIGAAWAVVFNKTAARIWYHIHLRRDMGTTEIQVLRALSPAVIGLTVMTVTGLSLKFLIEPYTLFEALIATTASVVIYIAAVTPLVWTEITTLRQRMRS